MNNERLVNVGKIADALEKVPKDRRDNALALLLGAAAVGKK